MNEYAKPHANRLTDSVRGKVALCILLGLTATGTMSACSVGGSTSDEATVASEPIKTAEPIPGDTDGDGELSEFEKQVHASKAPRDYAMPDGSLVAIDPTEPLPEPVKQVIAEAAVPIIAPMKATSDGDVFGPAYTSLRAEADAQAEATGKRVVYLFSKQGASAIEWGTAASGLKSTGLLAEPSKDAMLPKVQSWADSMEYEVIIVE